MRSLTCTFMDADLYVKWINEAHTLRGRVHSVYDTVMNVRTLQGELFTLSLEKGYYMPGSFQIEEKILFSQFEHLTGKEVFVMKDFLEVKGVFRVELSAAQVRYPSFRMVPPGRNLHGFHKRVKESLRRTGKKGGCLSFYAPSARMDLMEQELSLRIQSLKDAPDFERLLGLGRGLTPSGDDFCLGYLCMSRYFRSPATDPHRRALLETLRAGALDTTDVSREMLLQGVKERYIEPLTDFCESLLSSTSLPNCQESMHKLLNIGSTSGTDMATGAIFALDMLLEYENTGGNYGQ